MRGDWPALVIALVDEYARRCGVDTERLWRMMRGEEAIPRPWAAEIAKAFRGAVPVESWPKVEAPHFATLTRQPAPIVARALRGRPDVLSEQGRQKIRETGVAVGRQTRTEPGHAVYRWLDSLEPPRNLTWLGERVGRSRQMLQNYVRGQQKVRGKWIPSVVPLDVIDKVHELSGGRVRRADWMHPADEQ